MSPRLGTHIAATMPASSPAAMAYEMSQVRWIHQPSSVIRTTTVILRGELSAQSIRYRKFWLVFGAPGVCGVGGAHWNCA